MSRLLFLALLAIPPTANAFVIRSGADDADYRVPASAYPALVDMPGEGQGVLIAPRWVVTAAHAAPMHMQGMEDDVSIGGVARRVKRVITYPGYTRLPDELIKEALASGDLSKVHAFLASSNDIALIELASPVTDVTPVPLYRGNKEVGMTIELVGKGATGDGTVGQDPHSSHRTALRRAFNVIVGADARYVRYRFDPPPSALPLEGVTGSGDSGGPLFIGNGSSRQLVGLASWSKYPLGHPFLSKWTPGRPFVEGLYGEIAYGVRISSYVRWIRRVISEPAPVLASGCQTAPASLQQFLGHGGWGAPGSYVASLHDLNGDGAQEAVVLLTDMDWCGSGGCTLLVARHRGAAWRLVSKITLVHPPVVALDRKRSRWQSLGVTVGGGGVATHPVTLDFRQGRYPSNPTMLPVSPASTPSSGEPLIESLQCQNATARPNVSPALGGKR